MAPSRRKGVSKAAAAAAARRQWKVGDLVLAKVKGFPAWPATVSEPEKWGYSFDWKKVLVYFFGTQQIAFCNPADVEAFTEEKRESLLVKRQGKGADFVRAVQEIIDSYEKSKKNDQADGFSCGDEATVTKDVNSPGLSKSIGLKDPTEPLDSRLKALHSTKDRSEPVAVFDNAEAAKKVDSLHDKETLLEEPTGSLMVTETRKIATYSSRKRSRGLQAQSCLAQGKAPSVRRSRNSSRAESCQIQNFVMPCNHGSYTSGDTAANLTRSGSLRSNKRSRKSPVTSECHNLDSPAFVSNGSTEDNSSEIVSNDSDSFSLNEGSTMESGCNLEHSETIVEHLEGVVGVNKGLDLQMKAVVIKKKRKPSRKRVTNEVVEPITKLEKEAGSDPGICDTSQISQNSCGRLNEKESKTDGDGHLPLVKRARVRMGTPLSVEEEPNSSLQMEEKPSNEIAANSSGNISAFLNCTRDSPTDRDPFEIKGASGNISPSKGCSQLSESRPQHWKVKTNQSLGCSADGEAALPPSKRLHRALEAMSANAAEESQTSVETSATVRTLINGFSASSMAECPHAVLKSKDVNVFKLQSVDSHCNSPHIGASGYSTVSNIGLSEETTNSMGAGIGSQPIEGLKGPKHEFRTDVLEDATGCVDGTVLSGLSCSFHDVQSSIQIHNPGQLLPNQSSLCESLPSKSKGNVENIELSNSNIQHPDTSEIPGTCSDPVSVADDIAKVSAGYCTEMKKRNTDGAGGMNIESSESQLDDNCKVDGMFKVSTGVEHKDSHMDTSYVSISDGHLGDKDVLGIESSLSPTEGVEFPLRQSPPVADEVKVESAVVYRPRSVGKWTNHSETHAALASFEAVLGTLTRTKESIGRATRVAIDCAKFGVASKVVEIVARNLESESSLHKRVDLFFLVDSITQCSRGLKGDFGGIFPSAIQSLLPRLLSAAAPPGYAANENRRQCLKVLRLWLERRILPEFIIRHHIRELNSHGASSSAGAYSRRSARTERSLDDPVREMEGMLVDEYGSNSSIQLSGLCMSRMLNVENEGSDSDGGSFEAVTPEHNPETPEEQETSHPVVKHRHILEDVDGELEMEDAAPCAVEMSSTSFAGVGNGQASHDRTAQHFAGPFPPPLPHDVPPSSPPLPSSPPPLPPPPPPPPPMLPPPCAMSNPYNNDVDSKLYPGTLNMQENLQQSGNRQPMLPGSKSTIPDMPYHAPEYRDSEIQLPMTENPSSFGSFPVPPPNNIRQMDSARFYSKPFPPLPPHPAPSNQFSYVQADHHVKSQREVPPPSFSNRFNFIQNRGNGNYYNNHDRMNPPPYELSEGWRHPPPSFSGPPPYSDKPPASYPPAPYIGPPCEPPRLPNGGWVPPPQMMNYGNSMPRPPPNNSFPVSIRAPSFWRPR